MLKTPDWLKAMIPKEGKKAPFNPLAFSPIAKTNKLTGLAPIPTASQGQTGYTGAGADGVVQPLNRAERRLDEGELVLSADDTARVGDLVHGIVKASRMGGLSPDVTNTIRQSVGMGQEQRMATGSPSFNLYNPAAAASASASMNKAYIDKYNAEHGTGTASSNIAAGLNSNYINNIKPDLSASTNGGLANKLTQDQTLRNEAIARSNAGTGAVYKSGIPTTQPVTVTPPTTPTSTVNRGGATNYNNFALGGLRDIATGQSPYMKALANSKMQQNALSASAAEGAARQDLAQQGLQGTGVGNTSLARQGIEASRTQAGLAGDLAKAQMGEMAGATGNLATASGSRMNADYMKSVDEMEQLLKTGNIGEYAKRFKSVYGTDIDPAALQNADNLANLGRGAAAISTQLSVNPSSTIDDPVVKSGLETVWRGMGKTGPVDQAWATNYFNTTKSGGSTLGRIINTIPEAEVTSILGINLGTYKSDDGTAGYAGWQKDLAKLYLTGGVTFDKDGKWSVTDDGGTLAQRLFGTPSTTNTDKAGTPVSSTGGFQISGETSYYNGKPIDEDVKGNKIVSMTGKIGKTSAGDLYSIGDNGALTPLTKENIDKMSSTERASLAASPEGIAAAKAFVYGGNEAYAKEYLSPTASSIPAISTNPLSPSTVAQANVPAVGKYYKAPDGNTYIVAAALPKVSADGKYWFYPRTLTNILTGESKTVTYRAR